jgi:hypothetical protein
METAPPLEIERFLDLIRVHTEVNEDGETSIQPPMMEMTAAFAVGWTPRKLRALKKDPEFLQLIDEAKTLLIESVESMAYRNALRGNQRAIELVLFCHGQDRGWRPPAQRHEVLTEGKVEVSVIASVKEAVKATLATADIGELQRARIVDAEIVDDEG